MDKISEVKWQKTREGAITLISLDEVCPSRLRKILILMSDILLLQSLKIAGAGTLNLVRNRRGLSLLRDLGLQFSTEYLIRGRLPVSMLQGLSRLSGRKPEPQLPLPNLGPHSSVSVGNNVVRSFTPSKELVKAALEVQSPGGQSGQT